MRASLAEEYGEWAITVTVNEEQKREGEREK